MGNAGPLYAPGMVGRLRRAWSGLPVWARWVLAVYLIVFADGTGAHVRDLARGGTHAYSWAPHIWIQVFFTGLVVLDPLVIAAVAFVRREGVWLAAGVMVLDVAANATANWPSPRAGPARPADLGGLTLIVVVCVFVLATAPPLLRVVRRGQDRPHAVATVRSGQ